MKTSIIEVTDMLSVLTVDEVEKRFGEVPGVESATVNYAANNATVRYDETLLEVADIKILVHQRGQQSAGESKPKDDSASKSDHQSDDKPEHKHAEAPMPDAATGSASPPEPAAPKTAMPSPAAPPDEGQGAKPPPGAAAPSA
jgi:P-type Cu2+ transporter